MALCRPAARAALLVTIALVAVAACGSDVDSWPSGVGVESAAIPSPVYGPLGTHASVAAPTEPGYELAERSPGELEATNRAHGLVAQFSRGRLALWADAAAPGDSEPAVRLEWTGIGRGEELRSVPEPEQAPIVTAGRALWRHTPGLEQWWENGLRGIEHGFVLGERPLGDEPTGDSEAVTLELAVGGAYAPDLREAGQRLELRQVGGGSGQPLRYAGLWAVDATGRTLTTWMELEGSKLRLRIDDEGASYPVYVDPIFQIEFLLRADDGATGNRYGEAVSVAGSTALIGAMHDDDNGSYSGSAYVFVRTAGAWPFAQKLVASDGTASDVFGTAVAAGDDAALVGAPQSEWSERGSVYAFVRSATNWSQAQKLITSNSTNSAHFGAAVAQRAETALVGAPQDDALGTDSGSAFVFVRSATTWAEQQKLTANDGAADDGFGAAVALAGDTALVGAQGEDERGANAGAAYVFVRSATTWSQEQKLTAGDGASGDLFGVSVAVDGDTALVGANYDDARTGSAYVFVRSATTWSQEQKLTGSAAGSYDYFGQSVSLSTAGALVGAPYQSTSDGEVGVAYLFQRSAAAWVEDDILTPSTPTGVDRFGQAVSISPLYALVGAPYGDGAVTDSGLAYVFEADGAALGTACSIPVQCQSGHCVDSVCCESACGADDEHPAGNPDDCFGCSVAAGSSVDGTCAPRSGSCDDGVYCNGTDSCNGTECTEHAGDPCPGPDDDSECSESCNEEDDQCNGPDPDGAGCDDDLLFCNGAGRCEAGLCNMDDPELCAGRDGDDDCHESCDETARSCDAYDGDGAPCVEGGFCAEGSCRAPDGTVCADAGECMSDFCVNEVCCAQQSCGAFRCGAAGECLLACATLADCADGYRCAADGQCVPNEGAAAGDEGGCGCASPGHSPSRGGGLLAALIGLALRRRIVDRRALRR